MTIPDIDTTRQEAASLRSPGLTRTARSLAQWSAIFLVGSGAAACFKALGKGVGDGAVIGARDQLATESTRVVLHQVTDTAIGYVNAALQRSVVPTLNSTTSGILADARTTVRGVEDTLAIAIEGRLSESLQRLVAANLASAGTGTRNQVHELMHQVSLDLTAEISPAIDRTVQSAGQKLASAVSERFADEWERRLSAQVESTAARAAKAAAAAGGKEVGSQPVWKTVVGLVIGIIVAILALAAAWIWRQKRRSQQALSAVTQAINSTGTPELKAEVKRRAMDGKVEGWLHDFLEKQGHL
jgi:hypothetical protein